MVVYSGKSMLRKDAQEARGSASKRGFDDVLEHLGPSNAQEYAVIKRAWCSSSVFCLFNYSPSCMLVMTSFLEGPPDDLHFRVNFQAVSFLLTLPALLLNVVE